MTAVDHAELGSDLGYWEMEAGRLHEGRKLASEFSEAEWGFLKRALSQSIALLSEIEGLKAERRNIVSHATMGTTDGEGLSVNQVSVEITRLRNELYARTQAPDSWRPIETAPKDGTPVYLFPSYSVATWDLGAQDWLLFVVPLNNDRTVADDWSVQPSLMYEVTGGLLGDEPTHWMPLPAAPALRPQTAESGT